MRQNHQHGGRDAEIATPAQLATTCKNEEQCEKHCHGTRNHNCTAYTRSFHMRNGKADSALFSDKAYGLRSHHELTIYACVTGVANCRQARTLLRASTSRIQTWARHPPLSCRLSGPSTVVVLPRPPQLPLPPLLPPLLPPPLHLYLPLSLVLTMLALLLQTLTLELLDVLAPPAGCSRSRLFRPPWPRSNKRRRAAA